MEEKKYYVEMDGIRLVESMSIDGGREYVI